MSDSGRQRAVMRYLTVCRHPFININEEDRNDAASDPLLPGNTLNLK